MFDPFIEPKSDFKNILLLSYYKNMILHLFMNESLVAIVLISFGESLSLKEGVSFERFYTKFVFLQNIIQNEVLIRRRYYTRDEVS